MKKNLILLLLLSIMQYSLGQSISNITALQDDKSIIVSYTLTGKQGVDSYHTKLFVSTDDGKTYQEITTHCTGDIGKNITPGSKSIQWDVLATKERLQGSDIRFKVIATYDDRFGNFTDSRDGKTYKTVKIGNQIWMAENLNYDARGSKCYDNKIINCDKYGRLYTFKTIKSLCPLGWSLPNNSQFETLLGNIGGRGSNAFNALNEGGISGFNAFFGGWRYIDGGFNYIEEKGYWWSSSEDGTSHAWHMNIDKYGQNANMSGSYKELGLSVRCLRDN